MPTTPSPGDAIGVDIATVGSVVAPIVATLDPPIGAAVTLGFKVLAVLEPAVYKAVAALISGKDLTPEQQAELDAIENKLQDPGQYYADAPGPAAPQTATPSDPAVSTLPNV